MEHLGRAVRQRELVVAGRYPAPLLQVVAAAFHHVAALVGLLVVGDRPAANGALALPVGLLVAA